MEKRPGEQDPEGARHVLRAMLRAVWNCAGHFGEGLGYLGQATEEFGRGVGGLGQGLGYLGGSRPQESDTPLERLFQVGQTGQPPEQATTETPPAGPFDDTP